MPQRHRPSLDRVRATSAVALLALTLALLAGLAYQALRVERSQRALASGVLRGHSAVAVWEVVRQAREGLLDPLAAVLAAPLAGAGPPGSDALERMAAAVGESRCGCLGGVRALFRVELRSGALSLLPRAPLPAGALAWLPDTIAARLRAGDLAPYTPRVRGAAPGRAGVEGAGAPGALLALAAGPAAPSLVAFLVVPGGPGEGEAYGVETAPAPFLAPIISGILRSVRPAPPLAGGALGDSVFALRIDDAAGRELYRSAPLVPEAGAAVDTLPPELGSLIVRAALRPAYAERLTAGGVPPSRLPQLVGLVALTALLLVLGAAQHRRQQELARLRAGFIAGVSHELRTPLAQIRLFAELLQSPEIRDAAERRQFTRIIDEEAQRLSRLVENVLSFSRLEQARLQIAPEPLDLALEARRVVEEFEPLARSRRAELRVETGRAAVARVDADAYRQILVNLLDNAVKLGPEGGCVTVRVEARGSAVRTTVTDQGPGVPPAERRRVFEAYYRLPRDVDAGVGGSGIGLAVVAALVALHGGEARVEEAPGGGARFVVDLPAPEEEEP